MIRRTVSHYRVLSKLGGGGMGVVYDKTSLLDSIRKEPEFAAIREEALRKQKEFLARRSAPKPS